MYLVVIAWMYVTLMMAVAEATSPEGSVLGALITFGLYGLLPLSLVVYAMGAPGRSRAIKAAEQRERESARAAAAAAPTNSEPGAPEEKLSAEADPSTLAPDTCSEPAACAKSGAVAPVRKEP